MPHTDQGTLITLLGILTLYLLLFMLFLSTQIHILLLLYTPLPQQEEPAPEDLHNDPTLEVRSIPCP